MQSLRWLPTSAVAVFILAAVACDDTTETGTRTNTFSMEVLPKVEVMVGNGKVDLDVGPPGEIVVSATLKNPDRIDYEVFKEGNTVVVEAITGSDSRADVTLIVPEDTEFQVDTGNGGIKAVGLKASGRVDSGSGEVRLERIGGDVHGNAGNGGISLNQVSGSVVLSTGNGQIVIRNSRGSFDVNSGNGSVILTDVAGIFDMKVGNASITFLGEFDVGSESRFTSGNGAVTVELLDSQGLELDLESDGGQVRSDLPVTVREQTERRLLGTIAPGEAKLIVRSSGGDITIK